jgi:hypothetical protein
MLIYILKHSLTDTLFNELLARPDKIRQKSVIGAAARHLRTPADRLLGGAPGPMKRANPCRG